MNQIIKGNRTCLKSQPPGNIQYFLSSPPPDYLLKDLPHFWVETNGNSINSTIKPSPAKPLPLTITPTDAVSTRPRQRRCASRRRRTTASLCVGDGGEELKSTVSQPQNTCRKSSKQGKIWLPHYPLLLLQSSLFTQRYTCLSVMYHKLLTCKDQIADVNLYSTSFIYTNRLVNLNRTPLGEIIHEFRAGCHQSINLFDRVWTFMSLKK